MTTNQPQYFNDLFLLNTSQSAVYTSLPHILKSILTPLSGQIADYLIRNKGITSIERKFISFLLCAIIFSDENIKCQKAFDSSWCWNFCHFLHSPESKSGFGSQCSLADDW